MKNNEDKSRLQKFADFEIEIIFFSINRHLISRARFKYRSKLNIVTYFLVNRSVT